MVRALLKSGPLWMKLTENCHDPILAREPWKTIRTSVGLATIALDTILNNRTGRSGINGPGINGLKVRVICRSAGWRRVCSSSWHFN
jgi:hypothetical protein